MAASTEKGSVVICGGGIIGASIAYYLALRGVGATIVERCEPACAASGKAGGFLALDWNDDSPVEELGRRSFQLHAELATTFGEDTLYRPVDTLSVAVRKGGRGAAAKPRAGLPGWVDGGGAGVGRWSEIGSQSTTAQVHPGHLTRALIAAAEAKAGAVVLRGVVQGMKMAGEGSEQRVEGVLVDGRVLPADQVVIAMGPWSGQAAQWFDLPPITGAKYHSIVVRPQEPVTAHCLFLQATGRKSEPEVYPRPNGEVYICGEGEEVPLPDDPADIHPLPRCIEQLQGIAASVSTSLASAELQAQQACYLPLSPDGIPLLGKVPGTTNAFVATGHSCWGILNGPASGEAMAQLMLDGKASSVDLSPFDPGRFL